MSAIDARSATGEEELLTVSSSRGVVPRSSASVSMFKAESYVGHKLCWPDDLVINSLWAWARGLGVASDHGIVSTAYGVYRQRQEMLLPAYLNHLVRSEPFQWELQVRSQGVWKSRLQMTDARWLDAPLLIPLADEQAAIVKYLAHANARIDKVIAAKRRLIRLLEEQQQSMVAAAISQLQAPVLPLKRALKSVTAGTWGDAPEESNDPARWCVRVADFDYSRGRVRTDTSTVRAVADRDFAKRALVSGDLLLEGSGGGDKTPVGRVVLFDHQEPAVCSNFLQRLRVGPDVEPEFLCHVLRSFHATGAIRPYIKQTTGIQNLDLDQYLAVKVPVPTLAVQRDVVALIAAAAVQREALRARAQAEIELLLEFRARLIADVVTGQVDVRDVATSLPDLKPDAATADQTDDEDALEVDDALEMSEV